MHKQSNETIVNNTSYSIRVYGEASQRYLIRYNYLYSYTLHINIECLYSLVAVVCLYFFYIESIQNMRVLVTESKLMQYIKCKQYTIVSDFVTLSRSISFFSPRISQLLLLLLSFIVWL